MDVIFVVIGIIVIDDSFDVFHIWNEVSVYSDTFSFLATSDDKWIPCTQDKKDSKSQSRFQHKTGSGKSQRQ